MSGGKDFPERDEALRDDASLIERLREADRVDADVDFRTGLRAAFLSGFPGAESIRTGERDCSSESRSRAPLDNRKESGEEPTGLGSDQRPGFDGDAKERRLAPGAPPVAQHADADNQADVSNSNPNQRPSSQDLSPKAREAAEARLLRDLAEQAVCSDEPRPGFREDLRRCFLSGQFPAARSGEGLADEGPQAQAAGAHRGTVSGHGRTGDGTHGEGSAGTGSAGEGGTGSSRDRFRPGRGPGNGAHPTIGGRRGGSYGEGVSGRAGADRMGWSSEEDGEHDVKPSKRQSRLRLVRGVLAAAAAVLVIAVLLPREPQWELSLIEGDGLLEVAGFDELIPVEDFIENVDGFLEAGVIHTRGNRLELTLPGELVVELTPASTIDAAGLEARPRGGRWGLRIEQGEAFVSKSPTTRGRPLVIQTFDGDVEVLGTSLGVLCTPDFTCVCVAEGEVEVKPSTARVAPARSVTTGNTLLILRRGEKAFEGMPFPKTLCPSTDPHDHHVCALQGFTARHAAGL